MFYSFSTHKGELERVEEVKLVKAGRDPKHSEQFRVKPKKAIFGCTSERLEPALEPSHSDAKSNPHS